MDSGSMEFRQFEVVAEVAKDHYYLKEDSEEKDCVMNYRRIIKEWKILEKKVPKNTYVQAYGSRMDLLRAVIVGSQQTVFHDALFFFDIGLPLDYPDQPPRVHYHAHVNPNLFEGGKAVIKYWSKATSVAEVLESIHGLLVLDQTRCKDHEAFVLCWRAMLEIVRQPPQKFEGFVAQHFGRTCVLRSIHEISYYKNAAEQSCPDLMEIEEQIKNGFASTLGNPNLSAATMVPIKKPRKRAAMIEQIQKWGGANVNFARDIQKSVTVTVIKCRRKIQECVTDQIEKWGKVMIKIPGQIEKWAWEIINSAMQIIEVPPRLKMAFLVSVFVTFVTNFLISVVRYKGGVRRTYMRRSLNLNIFYHM